ncbi:SIMPL domain-containing protein [Candidatus Micrarchaeota archaeon]|nr:SIMPL domain-containing protein [Candidatus Micrarchaeota archaeon]
MEDKNYFIVAALLIAIGMIGGAYLLSNNMGIKPNIYVSSSPQQDQISVSASATQQIQPDLLQIQLRVQTDATTAKKSQSDNANISNALLAKLQSLGIAKADIQTTSYNVYPKQKNIYICPPVASGAPSGAVSPSVGSGQYPCSWDYVNDGYTTTQIISVKVRDLTKGGDVIDQSATVGTNQTFVDYISFGLTDETKDKMQTLLLKEAGTKAKMKAQNIADSLGAKLGKVLTASESINYPIAFDYRNYLAAVSSGEKTTLSPGQVEVSASLNVNYAIN